MLTQDIPGTMQAVYRCQRDKAWLAATKMIFAVMLAFAAMSGQAGAQTNIIAPEPAASETEQSGQAGEPSPAASPPELIKTTDASEAARASTEGARATLLELLTELDKAEATFQRDGLSDTDLAELRNGLDPIIARAQQTAVDIAPNVQSTRARIGQLGEPPAAGSGTESEIVASERVALNADLALYDGVVSRAKLLATRAQQLADRIAERRRALFSERIFERNRSALDPRLWYDAAAQSLLVASRFLSIMADWWTSVYAAAGTTELLAVVLILLIIGGLIVPARRLLLRFASRDPSRMNPSMLRRTSAAAWLVFVYAATPIIGLIGSLTLLKAFGLLTAEAGRIVEQAFSAIINFSVIQGLIWALLAPNRPTWRLIGLPDAIARRIVIYALSAGGVLVISDFLDEVNAVTFAPLNVVIGKQALASLLIAFFIFLILHSWSQAQATGEEVEGAAEHRWRWLISLAWIALAGIPVAAVLGYPVLAHFVASQFVVGGTILAFLLLGLRLIDALLTEGLDDRDSVGSKLGRSLGLKHSTTAQIGIVASGLLRVLLTIVAVSFLLVPWGIESKDVFGWVRTLLFGFTIGDLTISFSSILLAIAIFVIGWIVTRAIQRWLDQSLLPRTSLDSGVRNSIRTAFGYVGLVIAAAISVTYVGLDLSNLAIVAGALSLGIGFGLQSIVNNFVSGLILLVERPIKTGDWIVVGGEEGFVRKISVRSTEIETFDRASVIVPNSDLISGMVKNWMHIDKLGRIIVPIGVDYGADPELVRKLLLDCAHQHPAILRRPEPQVLFVNFGESSLDFELRAHVGHIDTGMQVRSDLRFAILAALREAGIDIPFPQRDLNVRGMEQLEQALEHLADATARIGGQTGQASRKPGSES